MILILAILGALVSESVSGIYYLNLVLWLVAGLVVVFILARAFSIGYEIDQSSNAGNRYTVRAHILLHIIPLTYFPVASALTLGRMLELIYLLPVIVFFVTGVRTWKHCYAILGRKLYWLFQVGNLQMCFFFPVAVLLDYLDWPASEMTLFADLMGGYFVVHFILTGITIPLMGRDLYRNTATS